MMKTGWSESLDEVMFISTCLMIVSCIMQTPDAAVRLSYGSCNRLVTLKCYIGHKYCIICLTLQNICAGNVHKMEQKKNKDDNCN